MARRTRQISLKECYEILNLQKGADLQAVKSAYRRRAFELHPDLNPGDPAASRQFQRLNEAYVALSAMLKPQEEARQKTGNKEADAQNTKSETSAQNTASADQSRAQHAYEEQDVLRDLLNDPFARRVFEDIYSELGKKKAEEASAPPPPPGPETRETEKKTEPARQSGPRKEPKQIKTAPLKEKKQEKGVKGVLQGWLRKQLDDEQTLTLPASGLFPGRKVRLQIRPGLSEEAIAVEVTLPPDFVVGKPLRLRGMGKRVGPWQGDLYLTINSE